MTVKGVLGNNFCKKIYHSPWKKYWRGKYNKYYRKKLPNRPNNRGVIIINSI